MGLNVPVDLHQRLSEFSYSHGVTREAERLLQSVGLRTTPFLPSLLQEAKLGFDVAFDRPGVPLLLQFKLGEALQRFHGRGQYKPPPTLGRPFWRFNVDTAQANGQFDLLLKAEQAGAEVYYVAPRLTNWGQYVLAYEGGQVLRQSLLIGPSEIDAQLAAAGEPDGSHRIVYDLGTSFVFSEAKELLEVKAEDFAAKIRGEIERRSQQMDVALQGLYLALEHRRHIRARPRPSERRGETAEEPAYVMRASDEGELASPPQDLVAERSRRFLEFRARATTEADARFAALGFEAWATGAQLIAVTLPKGQGFGH
jgi:hypothetical protein